jgi:CheY-like chemotaxis protein
MGDTNQIVMVVEDEEMLLRAIEKKLQMVGKTVIACASGQKAIEELKNASKLPDIIWLDYYLKDMNGLEFMSYLKTEAKWADIPVMVVSNSASPEKVSNMEAMGVKKYILKAESRLDKLVGTVDEVVGVKANP